MSTNQEFLRQAAITTDAIASAGKLSPEQAQKFVDYIFDQTALASLAGVRKVSFRNETWEVDKIAVNDRVAVPHTEAGDPLIRNGVTHSKISLTPKAIMVPFEIGDLYKQQNIEGDSVEDHVIRMMATQVANNLEQLYWYGDTVTPAISLADWPSGGSASLYRKDTYYGLFDGLLKQAESANVFDAANGDFDHQVTGSMIRKMPTKFRKMRNDMRFMIPWDLDQVYRENLSTRATATGDAALAGNSEMVSYGVPLTPVQLLESNPIKVQHVTLSGTTPVNLAYTNISDVVVTPANLGTSGTAAHVLTTDYTVNTTTGVITRVGGGGISDGAEVKVTYRTSARALLTKPSNIIIGMGLGISIEKDRNIYKRMNEYAIHVQTDIRFEEITAVVNGKNIKIPA